MTSKPMIYIEAGLLAEVADILARYGIKGASDELKDALHSAQPAAGEPIGKIVSFGPKLHEVAWSKGKLPPLGTELYTTPPAAAHGDEAK